MTSAAGEFLAPRLSVASWAEVPGIVRAAMADHEAGGCRYAEGAYERVVTGWLGWSPLIALPIDLLGYFSNAMEAEEVYCPRRGIGMAQAA